MRLSDAGMRCRKTKTLHPDHRLSPWPTEDATPRSLQPIVRDHLLQRVSLSILSNTPKNARGVCYTEVAHPPGL
jgi:hypothetical protein